MHCRLRPPPFHSRPWPACRPLPLRRFKLIAQPGGASSWEWLLGTRPRGTGTVSSTTGPAKRTGQRSSTVLTTLLVSIVANTDTVTDSLPVLLNVSHWFNPPETSSVATMVRGFPIMFRGGEWGGGEKVTLLEYDSASLTADWRNDGRVWNTSV